MTKRRSTRELERSLEDLETGLDAVNQWRVQRIETDLSPLAQRWLELDDIYHEEGDGFGETVKAVRWLCIDPIYDGAPAADDPPAIPTDKAREVLDELIDYEALDLLDAFSELTPDTDEDTE